MLPFEFYSKIICKNVCLQHTTPVAVYKFVSSSLITWCSSNHHEKIISTDKSKSLFLTCLDIDVATLSQKAKSYCFNDASHFRTENKITQNRKVTDYYPIRRSNRKTKSELKNEEHKHIDEVIKCGSEEGMQVKHIEGKGRGVFAVKGFKKGQFVVEYHGDLLELVEAKLREAQYAKDPQTGCYMYYFQYQSKTYCVDATKETTRLGRLINHSKSGNCQTKLHPIDGTPHLILVASRDIKAEEELLYDYGDRSKASVLAHPWLKH
uniref:[histone H4]-lysine(20) N-methyltransferase n=1 Tax=Mola mola TaxID=94237 RepID=A0A3Q3XH80_MOLML